MNVFRNLLAAAGLACLVYAAAQVHAALGWATAGATLTSLGVGSSLAAAKRAADEKFERLKRRDRL